MLGVEHTNDNFQKGLLESEKHKLKTQLPIWVLVIISLYAYIYAARPDWVAETVAGFLIFALLMLMNYFFGYYGLAATALIIPIDSVIQFLMWMETGDAYNLAVVAMSVLTLLASAIISYCAEKDKRKKRILEWSSVTDGMTGLYNYRYFNQRLEEELSRAERNGETLVLCMMDIDEFKKFNDAWGHGKGDEALKATAEILTGTLRNYDVICRYGGDEFAVIFPNSNAEDVVSAMNRVKVSYRESIFNFVFDESSKLTLSIGFSVYPCPAKNKDELISQADSALYYAKSLGGNRIEQYQEELKEMHKKLEYNRQLEVKLRNLLETVSEKEKYICAHCERVANYAVLIGQALNMTHEELYFLRIGAMLHDIGKFKIPEEILNKKGKLTEEEFEVIKEHSVIGADIVDSLSEVGNVVENIRHHHERFDGKGYPDGVSDVNIPIGARILAVADAFDAMQWDRPYRKALSLQESLQELADNAGTQFDPELVRIFIQQFWQREVC